MYRQILQVDTRNAEAMHFLGVIYHQVGQNDVAVELMNASIEINGHVSVYRINRGIALKALGRFEEALVSYYGALCISPDAAEAHVSIGNSLQALGRLDAAVTAYKHGLRVKPDIADTYSNMGSALRDAGRIEDAVAACRTALMIKPDCTEAHTNMANALRDAGRHGDAIAAYTVATRVAPNNPETHSNLGVALRDLGRHRDAIDSYSVALRIKPDYAEAHSNLGNTLRDLGLINDSLASFHHSVCIKPDYDEAYYNLGIVLAEQGKLGHAMACYGRTLTLNPGHAHAHFNRGNCLLLSGRLLEGWKEIEWRHRRRTNAPPSRKFEQPQWTGQDLSRRTLLLHAEVGLGDTIQFSRYVPLVAALGTRVILEVQAPLMELLSPLKGRIELVAKGDPLPPFDLHCPLMSLPLAFGTTQDTIPPPSPHFLIDLTRVAAWRKRLPAASCRIGIAWASKPLHGLSGRSLPVAMFAAFRHLPGVQLVSLQKQVGLDQLTHLTETSVHTLGADFDEGPSAFLDTVAVMASLDLIIAIDSAVAHLAGTLGRPVWMPLQKVPHWTWGLDGETTSWYPKTRLFRQSTAGRWEDVFARMATELEERSQV